MVIITCNLNNGDNSLSQIKESIQSLNKINYFIEKGKEICLDLSENKWMLPCSSLLLSHAIEGLRIKGYKIKIIRPKKVTLKNHLKRIGFPFGGEIKIQGCLPIVHFQKNVKESVDSLFHFIDENFPNQIKGNAIKYLISELSDNIEQHSKSTHASLMAQYFPQKNFIKNFA